MNATLNVSNDRNARLIVSQSKVIDFDNTDIEGDSIHVAIIDKYSNASYLFLSKEQADELSDALIDIAMTISGKYCGRKFHRVDVVRPTIEADDV
jgi:hypothetical protein